LENLDLLDYKDHLERLVQQERKALRDTVDSSACRACLVPSVHLVRRVHLVPPEPMGSPEPLDPEVHLALMEQLVLLA